MSGADTVTDGIIADQIGGELGDSIAASKKAKRERESAFASPTDAGHCSNCNTKLTGPVCHSCGQVADTYHRPVWELMGEVLDGLFGWEGRLWRTVPPLMFKPGKITEQYLSGVRARYVMPFRLYLTASILFFLLFFALNSFEWNASGDIVNEEDIAATQEELERGREGLEEGLQNIPGMSEEDRQAIIDGFDRTTEGTVQSLEEMNADPNLAFERQNAWREEMKLGIRQALVPEDFIDPETGEPIIPAGSEGVDPMNFEASGLEDVPVEGRRALAEGAGNLIDDGGAGLVDEIKDITPTAMFFLVPIYALMLGFTHFYKRGYFFYDHMVVALHFHAFLFFAFIFMIPISALIGVGASTLILLIWSNYYLYRLHRTVYSHGRFSSALRTIFLDFLYLMVLSFASLIVVIIAAVITASN